MAIQDLTPQLRTRLSRVEWVVGIFVLLAVAVLLAGFFYYLRYTAQRKGWFLMKAPFYTFVDSAEGLKQGDGVKLMGFEVGEITQVSSLDPEIPYGVRVDFYVREPYFLYVWADSRVRVNAGLIGNRHLEVTKGGLSDEAATNKPPVIFKSTAGRLSGMWFDAPTNRYGAFTGEAYWLLADEAPDVSKRLDRMATQIERALPGILALTNQVASTLGGASLTASNLNYMTLELRPAVTNINRILAQLSEPKGAFGDWLLPTNMNAQLQLALGSANVSLSNLAQITGQLREPKGALGEWLIPTNLQRQLDQTFASANLSLTKASALIEHSDTNLASVVTNLNRTLENLAGITGGLNAQVQSNTNLVRNLSETLKHADDLVQGLKKHWLLKSAFEESKTNKPAGPGTVGRSKKPLD